MILNLQPLIDKKRLTYKTIRAPEHLSLTEDWVAKTVPLEQLVETQILEDRSGIVLCLYPASHELDPEIIKQVLRRPLTTLPPANQEIRLAQLISGIGSAFAKIIIDEALSNHDTIYFRGNSEFQLIAMETALIEQLHPEILLGSTFSDPKPATTIKHLETEEGLETDLLERIKHIDKLPVLPETAQKLLLLKDDPKGTVTQLVTIIERDVSLAAQITRYANSALFGMNGKIKTLQDAIFRVLGYETALYLSLGISMGRCFKLPDNGPLGSKQFWQHATYSAALCQKLAVLMPKSCRVQPGIAYLTGLLHDIGMLVMAQLFTKEFNWLNKMASTQSHEPIGLLEERLLGTTHMQLGEWLMTHWGLPREMVTVAANHHNTDYSGFASMYVQLVGMVDRLLKTHGLSDADTEDVPELLFEQLGLEEAEVYEAIDQIVEGSAVLDSMVATLSA